MAMERGTLTADQVDPPAELVIDEVIIDPGTMAPPGANVEVEVVATDQSGSTADSVVGYCVVTPSHLTEPVVFHCALMTPGSTFTFESVCSICPGAEGFEMPSQAVDIDIAVGGGDRDADCPNQEMAGVQTDSMLATVQPGIADSDPFVVPGSCGAVPSQMGPGETAAINATVQNNVQGAAVVADVALFAGSQQIGTSTVTVSANGQRVATVTITAPNMPGQTLDVSAEVVGASLA